MPRTLFALALCLFCSAATAGPVEDARQAYLAGQYDLALEVIAPAAEAGDPIAQNILGAAYDDGNGVAQDFSAALMWWEKAAGQGFSKAQYNLGKLLAEGRPGIEADPARAEAFLRAAMSQNNADAFNEMGLLYALGRGRPIDPAKAMEFYQQGAELGSRVAISNLGAAYAKGEGVGQDYAKAFEHISRAAAMEDPQALHNMGILYENGYHVVRDLTAAVFFYDAAYNAGYDKSAWHLSTIIGVPGNYRADPVEGLALCLWAANALPAERAEIEKDCAKIAEGMTEEQRTLAQQRAAEL